MTDPTPETPAATDSTPAGSEQIDTPPDQDNTGKEAAKYRRALRETETERDTLRTRLEGIQRAEVERLAATEHRVTKPAGIWSAGTDLAQLLDDDGNVDAAKVKAATETAIETLGLAVRPELRPDPSQGARGGVTAPAGWADLLRSR